MSFTKLIKSPDLSQTDRSRSHLRYGHTEQEGWTLQTCFIPRPDESDKVRARVIEFSGYSPWSPQDFVQTGWAIERVGWTEQVPPAAGQPQGWNPASAPGTRLPWSIRPVARQLGLSLAPIYKTVSLFKLVQDDVESDYSDYIIQVGPGVIVSQLSSRFRGPHWSDVALAVYKQYERVPLKYVFRVDITNETVERLVSEKIYSPTTGLRWPDSIRREWQFDSSEYRALLGTPLGRGVVALVLRGYDRGSKLVSSISTFSDAHHVSMHMLFVISDRDK